MITIKDFKQNGFLGDEIKTFIEDNVKYYNKHFSFCEELNRYSYVVIDKPTLKANDTRGLVIMSIFVKILNAFQAAIILYKYGLDMEAQTVTRPALESLFVLAAIINEDGFYDNFVNLTDVNRERILSKIKEHPMSFPDYQDIPELNEIGELREKNKKGGIIDYKKYKIADFAGLTSLYDNAYSHFSDAVHPNLGNICGRYWTHDGEKVKEIKYIPNVKDIEYTLKILCVIIIEALACLDDYFKLDLVEELKVKAEAIPDIFKE